MKTLKIKLFIAHSLFIILFLSIITAFNTVIIDNRDYKEDEFEVYVFDNHIGYWDKEYSEFTYVLTGKKK